MLVEATERRLISLSATIEKMILFLIPYQKCTATSKILFAEFIIQVKCWLKGDRLSVDSGFFLTSVLLIS